MTKPSDCKSKNDGKYLSRLPAPRYHLKEHLISLKAGFCVTVPAVTPPKWHGKREGLVGRCLREDRGLSEAERKRQCM